MSFYDYAAEFFVRHLEHDIEAHEQGRYEEVGAAFDDAPEWSLDEQADEEGAHRLGIAYTFWDEWIDARNHDWGYYPGVGRDDWPLRARQICQGLREKWEPERMDNALVRSPAPPRVLLWRRLRDVWPKFG